MGAPHASLWLQESVGGDVVGQAAHGYERGAPVVGRRFPARGDEAVRRPNRALRDLARRSTRRSATHRPRASGSYVVAPFTLEGRWGAIAVAFAPEAEYGDRELELLGGLAHQAKLAIANASSFAGLERTFLSTVEALANALEARDEYTSSHARWITDMAIRVGSELGLDGDTLKRLELGALFHDIGKIGIPNSVLLEAGPAERGGAPSDRDAPRARREDHRPDRPAPGRLRHRPRVSRALGRPGLSGPEGRRGDPARGADHLRLRRLPRDDDRPAVPPRSPVGRGAAPAGAERRLAIRPAGRRGLPARPRRAPELAK